MRYTRGNKLVAAVIVACMSIALFLATPIKGTEVLATELPSLLLTQEHS